MKNINKMFNKFLEDLESMGVNTDDFEDKITVYLSGVCTFLGTLNYASEKPKEGNILLRAVQIELTSYLIPFVKESKEANFVQKEFNEFIVLQSAYQKIDDEFKERLKYVFFCGALAALTTILHNEGDKQSEMFITLVKELDEFEKNNKDIITTNQ